MQESVKSSPSGWRQWWKSIVIGAVALTLNVLAYILLPPSLLLRLGRLGYISGFVVAAIANASVILPVPYYPLIVRLSQALNVWGVILAAAAGSTIGESVTFFVGRTSHSAVQETRINNWIERQLRLSWRAGPLLFALAAVPNPAFDIAGLLAGAFGVPFWLFLVLVFLGRIIRMSLVAFAGPALESI